MPDPALVQAALAALPALAEEAGLPAEGWQMRPLSERIDARVARILLRLDRPGMSLVLKHEARPHRPEAFAAAAGAHMEAQAAFPTAPGLGIPALLAVDIDRQSLLMEHAAARPIGPLFETAPHGPLLTRAGAWVGAFHSARPGTRRIFQPKFTLRYLDRILGELDAGTRAIAAPDRFRAAAAAQIAGADRFEGRETVAARLHGDLHLRNILVGEAVWGIDFTPGDMAPVGHDLARLLVDYATLHADHAQIASGDVLPQDAEAAFFEGYRVVGANDPSVGLLLRHRVLADWWGLPADPGARSPAQARRFERLQSLADRTFGV
ncbi:phosphotransferase [Roseivivax sediminis]|uniref:Phosphotransferase enzyme family protein n=1 Tax=Roseivivax sediminis TaxID=936889 RepID=A0A1I1UMP1_9RHOB|nr:phosphotransferase [Roseivivax sediminis]SFD72019.1 Phosphotransferase enzyme family protein [Roseivivax sediminis]